jgi:hypothetical protein
MTFHTLWKPLRTLSPTLNIPVSVLFIFECVGFLFLISLDYEFNEEVAPVMALELASFVHDPVAIAHEHAHNIAFHSGLGGHRLAVSNKFISNFSIAPNTNTSTTLNTNALSIPGYAKQVYQKGNIALVASGASNADLTKWTSEFFDSVPTGSGLTSSVTKYFGGENRTYNASGDALVIAFPGTAGGPSYKPEFSVLAYLLGGRGFTKWNRGTSVLSRSLAQFPDIKAVTKHTTYSDAGLLSITITGPQKLLGHAGNEVTKAINSLANVKPEDVKKAIAQAKFELLVTSEDRSAGLELVGQSVIASGQAPQIEDAVRALEGVTADKVKTVCYYLSFQHKMIYTDMLPVGCQGSSQWKSYVHCSWRFAFLTICFGYRVECVDTFHSIFFIVKMNLVVCWARGGKGEDGIEVNEAGEGN